MNKSLHFANGRILRLGVTRNVNGSINLFARKHGKLAALLFTRMQVQKVNKVKLQIGDLKLQESLIILHAY